jgi:hypothetical protein
VDVDFREPGRAVFRFRAPGCLPGYGGAAGLRCWLFDTAAVYAPDRETATALADAGGLRLPAWQVSEALAGLPPA